MKKSLKTVLLALLALCLCASAGFAEALTLSIAADQTATATATATATLSATEAVSETSVLQAVIDSVVTTPTTITVANEVTLGTGTTNTSIVISLTTDGKLKAATATDNTKFSIASGTLKYGEDVVKGNEAAIAGFAAKLTATVDGSETTYDLTVKLTENGTICATVDSVTTPAGTFTTDEQTIAGELAYDEETESWKFTPKEGETLTGTYTPTGEEGVADSFEFDGQMVFGITSDETTGKYTLMGTLTSEDEEGEEVYTIDLSLGDIVATEYVETPAAFVSADIKITASGDVTTLKITSTSKDAYPLYVDLGATVKFDLNVSSPDVVSAEKVTSTDKETLASADAVYTVTAPVTSGDSFDVKFAFVSTDADTFVYTIKVIASGDSSSSATAETYLLKVSDITITPAGAVTNTAKLISADTDNYSATLNLTNLNSTASGDWGSFAEFTVSSDYLGGSFSITVSTDAKLVNVYVMNGTDWDEVDTEELSGKVITPNTIGTYKVVLSADLIASSDKKVSGDAYFAFDFKVVSVDAPKSEEAAQDVVTDAANASADAIGGVGGNPIISAGQKIDTKFLSGTAISPSAFASFFSSATTVTMLSETELAAALETLGLDEDDMGDSENGYKALAFGLPSGFTLTANEKFFVLLTTNENGTGTNRLGVGVVSPKLDGSRTMVIVFKLLKNPAHTADFMTFDAGEYFVGATNDTASADTSSSTRAVFVTAGGTFNIKSDEATLLQGQTASGTATPYEDDDDDDDQETSSHGSSSGCDAGFGALALLAVAGALAARKVRK